MTITRPSTFGRHPGETDGRTASFWKVENSYRWAPGDPFCGGEFLGPLHRLLSENERW